MALLKEITNIQKPQWLQVNDTDTSWSVTGLNRINIVFGKNGCGKSSLLKNIASKRKIIMTVPMPESNMPIAQNVLFQKTSPERGGVYKTDGNIGTNISNDPNFMASSNLENENRQFRHIVSSGFERLLANQALHRPEEVGQIVVDAISDLSMLIPVKYYIDKSETNLVIKRKDNDEIIAFEHLSSGEKEMFSLGLDCIITMHLQTDVEHKVLLIDEPDVHVHPDLQKNFIDFLEK